MMLQQLIDRFIALVQECPALPAELAQDAAMLRERLSSGQLHLAVMGQFKRGKSTLINALLGAEILPDGVLPVTLVPVFLHYGPQPEFEIRFANGRAPERYCVERLGDFVNEANNPKNRENVSRVDLFYPADLLQRGIVLIDTPGIGSTLQHNTDTTLDFLPRCDAAVVVLSADPPITAAEVAFLQQLQPHVARLFFVLNKIDYLDSENIAVARQFLSETLQTSLGVTVPSIWTVSARQGLVARLHHNEQGWLDSGMADLEDALLSFAANGKDVALVRAVQKKAIDLVSRADQLFALQQRAASLPLEELEQRITAFHRYADSARQQRQEISDRLVGDQRRLKEQIEQFSAELREKAQTDLMRHAENLDVPTHDRDQTQRFREMVVDYFDREREAFRALFGEAIRKVLMDLTSRAETIREDLRRDAATLLEVPHFPMLAGEASVELAVPAWTIDRLPVKLTPTWSPWLPRAWQKQQQSRQRQELVNVIVVRNVEKIRYWVLKTVDESFRRFQYRMNLELEETIQQIDRALQAGYQLHQAQAENRQAILAELVACRERLNELRREFENVSAGK